MAFIIAAMSTSASGGAASSSTVVGALVPSATSIDVDGCPSFAAGVTSFGNVTPGSSVTTTSDCVVEFGSSNDSAALRAAQLDGWGTAMARRGWLSRPSGVATQIDGIDFANRLDGWAVAGPDVLRSSDGGASWSSIDIPGDGDPNYRDVYAVSALEAWVSGNLDGSLYHTDDGGASWTQHAAGLAPGVTFDAVAASGPRVWAGGNGNVIVRSLNGGGSWNVIDIPGLNVTGVNEIAIDPDGIVYVVVNAGGVWRSQDDGATWSQVWNPGEQLEGVHAAPDGSVWVSGLNGLLGRSDDGLAWTGSNISVTAAFENIVAFDRRSAIAVGRQPGSPAVVARTVDGGATWEWLDPGVGGIDFYAVDATSLDDVHASGVTGSIVDFDVTHPIPDWADAAADWDQGGNGAFGACLRDAAGGAITDGATWVEDAAGIANDCQAVDGDPWNAITTSLATIAKAPSGDEDATAHLRFGLRTATDTPPGDYQAHVRFEVVAPG